MMNKLFLAAIMAASMAASPAHAQKKTAIPSRFTTSAKKSSSGQTTSAAPARRTPFTVAPPPFVKFVELSATGVNLRQRPTTASARLVFEENEIGDLMLTWTSSTRLTDTQSTVSPATLAVLDEQGEWYQVAVEDFAEVQKAWVMKKFCRDVVTRQPLPSETSFQLISDGPYTGYFLDTEEVEGGFLLHIGQVINGFWAVGRTAFYHIDDSRSTTSIEDGYITFGRQYRTGYSLDLSKVMADADLLSRLMEASSHFAQSAQYYFCLQDKAGIFVASVPGE